MSGYPWNWWEDAAASKHDAVGKSQFHGHVNYTIFGSEGGIDPLANCWAGETLAQDAYTKFQRIPRDELNVEKLLLEDGDFSPELDSHEKFEVKEKCVHDTPDTPQGLLVALYLVGGFRRIRDWGNDINESLLLHLLMGILLENDQKTPKDDHFWMKITNFLLK